MTEQNVVSDRVIQDKGRLSEIGQLALDSRIATNLTNLSKNGVYK